MKWARWSWRAAPHALLSAIFVVEILAILAYCDGHFSYTLDDPYIHLALSQNIARGHYGLNANEPSSPSSSVLFPYLLALAAPFSFHEFAPLIINYLAMLAALALLLRILDRIGLTSAKQPALRTILAVILALYLNVFGVAFTGLEHSLHVALSLAVVLGLLEVFERDRLPPWLPVVLVVGPLVRFEALSFSLAALALLAPRRPAAALATLCCLALPLVAFSLMLQRLDLPWAPSSVLSKLQAPVNRDRIAFKFYDAFHRAKLLGLLLAAVLASQAMARFRTPANRRLAVLAAAIGLAHLLGGSFGNLARYETYLMATFAVIAACIYREPLHALLRRPWLQRAGLGLAAAGMLLGHSVNFPPVANPRAARNIHQQQFQMHRFAVEFLRAPVGANDIGRVAYRNPYYVLDLAGLASEEARIARLQTAPERLAELAERHAAPVAMIYRNWFYDLLPANWIPVARLRFAGKRVSAAGAEVAFYATKAEYLPSVNAALAAFGPTLPRGATLDIGPFSP